MRHILGAAAAVLVFALSAPAAWADTATGAAEAADSALKPVKLMVVDSGENLFERRFFGKVAARRTVDLAFQVAGRIEEFPVAEGAMIEKGSLIARLDLRRYQLALHQAELQRAQAERDVARYRQLEGSTISQVNLADAETRAALAVVAEENAAVNLEDATLLAPFDALVALRTVENYTTVAAGTPVVRLHDMSEIRVEIDVPEVLAQQARMDELTIEARFQTSPESYPMELREVVAQTSAIGQTYRVVLGMEPPEGLLLLPGASATVTASQPNDRPYPLVPASGIRIDNDGSTHVFVFEPTGAETGTLTRREVTVKPTATGEVRVVSGLEDGEEIVMAGVGEVVDGGRYRRFTGFDK